MLGDSGFTYWDSNVMLSYINNYADRRPTIDALLDKAEKGGLDIITSILSMVEVAFAEDERGEPLDSEGITKIDKLWFPIGPIKIVDFHRHIAQEARELQRLAMSKQLSLKPADAIHLATAKHHGCVEIHTYNCTKLAHFAAEAGCKICEPYVLEPKML